MRVLVQRVARAAVQVGGQRVADIGPGLLLYVAFRRDDQPPALAWMAEKVANLRIFEDAAGRLNRSIREAGGEVLAVSQFTLYGDARKGRRPGFDASAPAAQARPLFEKFVDNLAGQGLLVKSGRFQSVMQVESVNDGPVTLLLESPGASPGQ
ncbi:MAG: D-aminoacyl-tRNA deacylase [Candidatus Methylomirabilales bacterium]